MWNNFKFSDDKIVLKFMEVCKMQLIINVVNDRFAPLTRREPSPERTGDSIYLSQPHSTNPDRETRNLNYIDQNGRREPGHERTGDIIYIQ